MGIVLLYDDVMPIHLPPLPPVSRRQFLRGSVAAGIAAMLPHDLFAAEKATDPHTFALLADTHISLNPEQVVRNAKMSANLAAVSGEILSLEKRPAGVFINGDLALNHGELKDYDVFLDLLKPMREAGLPVHLTLGNHDQREHFHDKVLAADAKSTGKPTPSPVENKHAGIVESQRANFFLLDSLNETNKTPGKIGEAQLKWLASALDARHDKPAIIMLHHTPDAGHPDTKFGVMDTDELYNVILPRKQVKAYIYGHSHDWHLSKVEDIHLINQPPVAYVFNAKKPNGWVRLSLLDGGAEIELIALDKKHAEHGQKVQLKWRA